MAGTTHTQRPATIRGRAYSTDILSSLDPEFSVTASMPFMGNMSHVLEGYFKR